ncbi:uncharacterized protein LOC130130952 [Lampris incognitus]|uniref:uncharacterized protein LOC130130952 n=1 Tax=Lampris incognitus TaxID=2546036 RepID=UPI0024B62462|nr:uncharacterized protein LOC130130952 [Lampris incognitus]
MAGGIVSCLLWFFRYSLILLLLHDVEANKCNDTIHRKVGENVELPICSSSEGVNYAEWRFKQQTIIEWYDNRSHKVPEFERTIDMNLENLSLILKSLTLDDSGTYEFSSDRHGVLIPSTVITLQVYEVIMEPVIWLNSTWHESNSSCTVFLECSVLHLSSVSFSLTVGSHSYTGAKVFVSLQLQDNETVICNASNRFNKTSTLKMVTCVNTTSTDAPPGM